MKRALIICMKELRGFFFSPVAYIVITIFLAVVGWLFFSTFFIFNQAELRNFFNLLPIIFSFVLPAVTMRMFSEELRSGSYEIMMTMPVTTRDVVLGKYLAAMIFTVLMLLPTVVYGISISFVGDLDKGPWMGGYAGALFLAGAYIAVGLLASALTKNQIVAFITSMTACLVLTLIDKMLFFVPERVLGAVQYLGADYHFQNVARGIIDTRDIVYFVSVAFVMLYATSLTLRERGAQ